MAERAVSDLMEGAMEKIRAMVDSNAVVGTPITTPDGVTLIPVSRLSFGFASGGNDKTTSPSKPGIWGGGGAAVKVEPVGGCSPSSRRPFPRQTGSSTWPRSSWTRSRALSTSI